MLAPGRNRRLLPLVVASALALMALDAAGFGPITNVRRTVLSVGQPIGSLLGVAVAPLANTWNGAVHYEELADENSQLRRRVAELEGSKAGQDDLEADLRSLLAATEIDYLGDVERVAARVVSDRRTEIERVVEIDKGAEAGIQPGMPVVTGHGLIGMVELVTGNRSVIRLITDADMAVGVRSSNGLGLTAGRGDNGLGLLASPELAEAIRLGAVVDGERFVTSGVDRSLYPPGIPVGTLIVGSDSPNSDPGASVDQSPPESDLDEQIGVFAAAAPGDPAAPIRGPEDLTYDVLGAIEVRLQPLADLDRLGYLTVLLVEQPA